MNNKKEREREELHKTIWKIANELRGSLDGWDFKQYVLGLWFYRFISENIEHYVNENQIYDGIKDFKYRDISDDEALLGKLMMTVKTVTKKLGIKSYRTVINTGKEAGQEVFHLHIHILSGDIKL